MGLDQATRRNLELTVTLSGGRQGSLLSVIDRTVTGAGGRRLTADLSGPLTDPTAIDARLDMVQFFHDADARRDDFRDAIRRAPDIERALSRLGLGRGGPRDLAAIRDALIAASTARHMLGDAGPAVSPCAGEEAGRPRTVAGCSQQRTERGSAAAHP